MRSSLFVALALALAGGMATLAPEAQAQSRSEVRRTVEASMVLTGEIDIGTEGQVESFRMDQRDKVAADLASFVERSVATWRFEPILREGKPVRARTFVNIRMEGKAGPDGNDMVTLQAANFGRYDEADPAQVSKLKMTPPRYPSAAADRGGSGEVLLVVQVGRDGKVMDVIAEQVNLHVVGDEKQMQWMRETFARYSVKAARGWTFRPPSTGSLVDEPFWSVRVPVSFSFSDKVQRYGQWSAHVPGPRAKAPWRTGESEPDLAGLLTNGGVYMADANEGPRLLTPLGG